ncbi:kinesin-like protein KIF19 isoform X1 [Gopherus evgoodei]|uniref:kinesin-like protein KIF19 isoform X1 n=1 Tax=Gopherus evgoodei TaxID=1825980 RepID=UPI0011CFEE16|nr:kinesin-like protein KIF19 isoform X1 [Gopherus evgoodei]
MGRAGVGPKPCILHRPVAPWGWCSSKLLAAASCCYSRALMSPAARGSQVSSPGLGLGLRLRTALPVSCSPLAGPSPMASPLGSPLSAGQRRTGAGGLAPSPSSARKDPSVEQQLTVALRIRPINEAELEETAAIIAHRVGDQMVVLMDPSEDSDDILRANRSREKTFIFDVVFDHKATQEEVYVSTTKNLVEGVISGYNATIFAYGPTGAGKTYTMLGTDCDPGIYIRTLNDLFKAIEATSDNMDYTVSMSYLEIYNEVIRDLLNPSSGFLDLREDARGSIQIAGITEVSTTNAPEIMQLLTKGNKERTQEPTAANKTSSRSHAVLQVTVKQKSRVKNINEEVRVGRLFMVDLAGSERAAQTRNRGKRMKEGAHINRSLLALGNCISALSEKGGSRAQYVNFRDSKLTRLLKDSLGGNSRTVMIAHISPASIYFEESRTTLIYAYRAKNIKTRVKRNLLNVSYHIAQYTSIISDLRREIEGLKAKIENQEKEKSAVSSGLRDVQVEAHQDSEAYSQQEMNKLREQLIGAFKEQMEMRRSLMELENTNTELHIDTSRHLLTIADWEREKTQHARKCYNKLVNGKEDENMEEADREVEGPSSPEPHEVTVAREEINMLLAELRKTATLKSELEQRLANAKKKASQMEKLLPKQITSEDQREVLRLLCKAHELEVGNTELQANALYKENLLCQKDFVIQRQQQHGLLCEEIIQQQQMLIKGRDIPVPETLGTLYQLHCRELEEGTLTRLLLLHSVMSSTLRGGSALNIAQQLDLNKEARKGLSGNRKGLPSGAKFELPSVVLESDSDSYRSSKTTPTRKLGNPDTHLSPTFFRLPRTPLHQQKSTGVAVGKMTSKLCSPTSLDLNRRKSAAEIALAPLSLEALTEIAVSTKSISRIAASRRSRARHRDHGSELTSGHFFEEDILEPKYLQSSFTPEPHVKGTVSIESLSAESQRKEQLHYTARRELKKDQERENSVERKARKKRSRSLEPTSQKISKAKHRTPSSHNMDNVSEDQLPRAKLFQPLKIMSNLSHGTPAATKVKFPTSHHTEENPLQVLEISNTPPSTVQQSNAGQTRGQVLQKRVKGPIDGASNQPKNFKNLPRSK